MKLIAILSIISLLQSPNDVIITREVSEREVYEIIREIQEDLEVKHLFYDISGEEVHCQEGELDAEALPFEDYHLLSETEKTKLYLVNK